MKKKLIGLLISVLAIGAASFTVFAAPSYNCYTKITSQNRVATGVTTYDGATYCSVKIEAMYPGGTKTYVSSGVCASSATVKADAPYEFRYADSIHRIEFYENGYLNSFTSVTRAWAGR